MGKTISSYSERDHSERTALVQGGCLPQEGGALSQYFMLCVLLGPRPTGMSLQGKGSCSVPHSGSFLMNGVVNECLLVRRKHRLFFKRNLVFLNARLTLCIIAGGLVENAMNAPLMLFAPAASTGCAGASQTKEKKKRKEHFHV